jgi:hypothetical protein
MPLQDLIHKLTEGTGSRVLKLTLVFFAMVGLAVWYDAAAFKNLSTIEGMDAAQLARNLGEGRGFTTEFVRPFSIHLMKRHRAPNEPALTDEHPDLANAPLYPVLLALALKAMPFKYPDLGAVKDFSVYTPDLCITIFNQALFFLAVWMVWRLARRLFDEPVAWVSAAVFAGSELFWRFSVSGQSTMLLIVILIGLVEVLARLEPETREGATRGDGWRLRMAALTGLLVGLAGLTRYSFGWMIVPVALFLGSLGTPKKSGLIAGAVTTFAVVMAPWIVRNFIVSGTPFGTAGYAILQNTALFAEHQLERTLSPDFSLMNGGMLWHKLLVGVREILEKDLPRLGGSWVSAFFLVGLMVPFRNPTLRRLRSFIVGCLGMLLVVQALGKTGLSVESPEVSSENLLAVLAPVVLMFGASLFFLLLEQFGLKLEAYRMFAVGSFTVVVAAPLWFSLFMPLRSAVSYPPYYPPYIQEKAQWVGEKDLIMADFPWAVAWYGHRQSVWLSLLHREVPGLKYRNDFYALNSQGKPISALYLSARTMKTVETRPLADWARRDSRAESWEPFVGEWESFVVVGVYLFREIPTGFPLKQAPFGMLPELFLAETERSEGKRIKAE